KGGTGTFEAITTLNWLGGNLAGGGGTTRLRPGGAFAIDGATARTFTDHVLSLGGNGAWSGTATYFSGLGAVLIVEPGATLDVNGSPTLTLNQGGVTTLQVQGTLLKSGTGTASLHGLAVSGLVDVSAG